MTKFNKEDNLISILFEDDYIWVINKKNGLLSHCNSKSTESSVVSLLKKKKKLIYMKAKIDWEMV